MEEYIAFDSHKHYTWVEHAPGAIRQALGGCLPGTPGGDGGHGELVLDRG
jgi:hypothetical protein